MVTGGETPCQEETTQLGGLLPSGLGWLLPKFGGSREDNECLTPA